MTTQSKQGLIDEVKNIKRKASTQQFCHGELARKLQYRSNVLSFVLTLGAALAALATTAEAQIIFGSLIDEQMLGRVAAILSISVFILTMIRMEVRLGDKAARYGASAEAYTRLLRQIDISIKILDELNIEKLKDFAEKLVEEYADIAKSSPSIDNFLDLKQKYLQQIAISKQLDKYPFQNRKQIAKRLEKEQNANSTH